MAFLNFSVLAIGGILVGIPIVLHLLMRQRPKHQIFPALRFLRQRQVTNRRQMRVQNWLLLFLRCAAIALAALLMARPTVANAVAGHWLRALLVGALLPATVFGAALSLTRGNHRWLAGLLGCVSLVLAGFLLLFVQKAVTADPHQVVGDEAAPVAAVFAFDTSTRMAYQQANATRLQEAADTARWLIERLPADSEVAVLDTANPRGAFAIDIGAGLNIVDSLEISHVGVDLPDVVTAAIELAQSRQDKRQEVYVMTDLTAAAWTDESARNLKSLIQQAAEVMVYVIDVGVEEPHNAAIDRLTLSSENLSRGQTLRIEATVTNIASRSSIVSSADASADAMNDRTADSATSGIPQMLVEVYVEQADPTRPVVVDGKIQWPEARLRDRIDVAVPPGASQTVSFVLGGLDKGVQHGYLMLQTQDGLMIDNRHDFTFQVRETWPILLVTGPGANAAYLRNALSPQIWNRPAASDANATPSTGTPFRCDVIDIGQLSTVDLATYAAVALLDPDPQTESFWQRIADFVDAGGGLSICLGRNAQPMPTFNALAKRVLPGPLQLQSRPADDAALYLSTRNWSHPLLAPFRASEATIPWQNYPVYRHWLLTDIRPGASRVWEFTNGAPAIWETSLGAGRVLTCTTSLSDRRNDRDAWNWIPTGEDPFPFLILSHEMFSYLAGQSAVRLNVAVGNEAQLSTVADRSGGSNNADALTTGFNARYQLFTPTGDWQEVTAEDGRLSVAFTQTPGAYHLKPTTPDEVALGFSAFLPVSASQLQRISADTIADRLKEWFGADRFVLARGRTEIDRGVGQARVGREMFPFVLLLLCATLGVEHVISNRFYNPTGAA